MEKHPLQVLLSWQSPKDEVTILKAPVTKKQIVICKLSVSRMGETFFLSNTGAVEGCFKSFVENNLLFQILV